MLGAIISFRRDPYSSHLVSLCVVYLNHWITSLLVIPSGSGFPSYEQRTTDCKNAEAAYDQIIHGPGSLLLFQKLNFAVKLSSDAEDCSE